LENLFYGSGLFQVNINSSVGKNSEGILPVSSGDKSGHFLRYHTPAYHLADAISGLTDDEDHTSKMTAAIALQINDMMMSVGQTICKFMDELNAAVGSELKDAAENYIEYRKPRRY